MATTWILLLLPNLLLPFASSSGVLGILSFDLIVLLLIKIIANYLVYIGLKSDIGKLDRIWAFWAFTDLIK